jgi:hypothetical protein
LFIQEQFELGKLSVAGITSVIYLREYEQGKGIRYMEMRKRVMKELDRCRLKAHLKTK